MKYGHLFGQIAMGVTALGMAVHADAQNLPQLKRENADKVNALIGSELSVKPKRARRLLVFYKCEGFVHGDSIVTGNEAFRVAAEKTRAFQADLVDDYTVFKPENLARYDAVVLNNTTNMKTKENPFVVPALIDFVKSGKGLAVIHAGADNFNNDHDASEMIGGHFWGHPWGGGGTWAFHLDDPKSPVNAPFDGKDFKLSDEIYMQRPPFYSRAKMHILISLDLSDPATGNAQGQQREDKDYAVSWIRPYGKGRVFYTSFGHDARAWVAKPTLTHILNGVQYTLGDLDADDTPAGIAEADLQRIKRSNDQGWVQEEILGYTAHTGNDFLRDEVIRKVFPLLKAEDATLACKRGILLAMRSIGAPQDLSGLAEALKNAQLREWAMTVLAQTKGDDAGKCLADVWETTDKWGRCSLLNAFALRGESARIVPYVSDRDADVALAAIQALGRVGDQTALETLSKPIGDAVREDRRCVALGAVFGKMVENGKAGAAKTAAKVVFDRKDAPETLRAAAARLLVADDAGFFGTAVKDGSKIVRQTVIRNAAKIGTDDLVKALQAAAPADQVALIARLAANGAKPAVPAIAACFKAQDQDVVCAAITAIGVLGGADEVPAMVELMKAGDPVRRTAADTLRDMPAKGVGKALFGLARQNRDLIPVLGDRMETALLSEWKPLVTDADENVRKEAWKALGKNATGQTFATFLAWLSEVKDPELTLAGNTVKAAARYTDGPVRVKALEEAWKAGSPAAKRLVAEVMASFPDPVFEPLLCAAMDGTDKAVREAAVEALGNWNAMAPVEKLTAAYSKQPDEKSKRAVVRAAMKLIRAHAGSNARSAYLSLFKSVDAADRPRVMESLFRVEGFETFTLLQSLFGDATYGASAKACYVTLFDKQVKGNATAGAKALPMDKWRAKASHGGHEVKRAFDNDPRSRWTTGTPSFKGMWFELDLGEMAFLSEVTLDTDASANDTPNGCEVFTSNDGKNWSGPVAKCGGDTKNKTVFPLAVSARYLKFVTLDGRPGLYWSIHEIKIMSGLDKAKVAEIEKIADSVR